LIHSSRSDTARLVRELEAIAARAPDDLEVQSDLATAYGALGQWPKAIAALDKVIAHRDNDLAQLEPSLAAWPDDGALHYLAGIAHALAGEGGPARDELVRALQLSPGMPAARDALGALDAGGSATLAFTPALVRPWGDGDAIQAALDRYARVAADMARARKDYQERVLGLLGAVGRGPEAKPRPKTCPIGDIGPAWREAQVALVKFDRLGVDLEREERYLARHVDLGLTAGLLPNARSEIAAAKKTYRLALADAAELRAEWARGVGPELRALGCSDALLAAAAADPSRYHVIEEDRPPPVPVKAPPRAKPRTTFFVDNGGCPDPVEVWIDGALVGQVAPGRRSALVADGGDRTLCLLVPGAAQCGDRGTVRQIYLHDGWSVTMHCPKAIAP